MHIFNIGLVLLFIYLNLLLLFGGWVCVCVCVPPISNDVVCYFPIQSLAFHYPMGFTLFLCVCVISPGDIYRHTHTHGALNFVLLCQENGDENPNIKQERNEGEQKGAASSLPTTTTSSFPFLFCFFVSASVRGDQVE
jgi:hypothetical protein